MERNGIFQSLYFQYHISLFGNVGVLIIFFLAILKANVFSQHLSKCNLMSLERLDGILFKHHHIIFMMYIIISETVIKIYPLQHLEISRRT